MIHSMTGFASAKGELSPHSWSWDIRSVNAKGLDIRLRVPDWLEGLEPALRKLISGALARGNVTLSLRLNREEGAQTPQLNTAAMQAALQAIADIEAAAQAKGVDLAPSKAADLLGLRGMMDAEPVNDDSAALVKHLLSEAAPLIAAFVAMRAEEGTAIGAVLSVQLGQVETLVAQAADLLGARQEAMKQALQTNIAKVLQDGLDEARLAQELALIAVKSDVTEEIDRLRAHIGAARELLTKGGPIGRKMDFLMQEFNREANTLCSKSQAQDLTAVGLELKVVIDQMREQVQNIE